MQDRKLVGWLPSLMIVVLSCHLFILPVVIEAESDVLGGVDLLETHPSDQTAFTQGLELYQDQLVMGTGQYGESGIGWLDLETGIFHKTEALPAAYFGEGLTFTTEALWQLTWKEGTAFKRNPISFEVLAEFAYDGEGWGLAYDTERDVLWMSDGSDVLSVRDAQTFELLDQVSVHFDRMPVDYLNELEYVDGVLYANVWLTNQIVKINVEDGSVERMFDLTELIKQTDMTEAEREQLDVLNGIAHIEGQRFYLTGKWYPVIYEVELID